MLLGAVFVATVVGAATDTIRAETTKNASYLTDLENEILREQNLARTSPAAYARFVEEWLQHYKGRTRTLPGRRRVQTTEGKRGVITAIRFLHSQAPIAPLEPLPGLSSAARDHVEDTGKKGWMGHVGSDDSEPADRVSRYGTWYQRVGENITYGGWNAREFVIRLIIDDGIPDRGHRRNLFNPDFRFTGIAFGRHSDFGTMCVIDYVADYDEY